MRLLGAQVKVFEISYASFWKEKMIPLQILYPSWVSQNITSLYFFSSNDIYFAQKKHIKAKIFGTVKFLGQNLRNCPQSILKWQVSCSSNFVLFFIVMTHNSSVAFKPLVFLLWIKGSHQSLDFETFKCSGEKLLHSSCHFPNRNSLFLQI